MLLFLDIDGVMVPEKRWKSPEFLDDGFPAFSSQAIQALQSLISEDVTIMLTSSHKLKYTIEEWKTIFKNRGISIEKISALNTNSADLSRTEEIMNWFKLNKVSEDFAIIDDDKSLNSLPDYLKAHLILTNPMVGLTHRDCRGRVTRH